MVCFSGSNGGPTGELLRKVPSVLSDAGLGLADLSIQGAYATVLNVTGDLQQSL